MKNLKKLVSVMVTVAMLISSLAAVSVSADYNDVDTTNSYYKAIKVLSGLGIVKGDDEGNFNPTNDIKRSEAVALVCRMVGEDALATAAADAGFDDVPADHWAAGYIAWGVASEVVKGVGDNKFDPDAPVKFQDIIVMISRVTGYERIANRATYGGYPTGYLKVASQYGLLDNGIASYAGAKAATREVVAQALYNGLTMPLVQYTTYGENPEDDRYVIYDGAYDADDAYRSTLTYTGKVYKVSAVVEGTAKSNPELADDKGDMVKLAISDKYEVGKLPSDLGSKVFVGESDIADFHKYTVEAYIAYNDDLDDYEVLVAVPDTKSVDTVTVSAVANDIRGYETGKFTYGETIKSVKDIELDIVANPDVYYNGKELNGYTAIDAADLKDLLENYADVITFVGEDDEYSSIFVTDYAYAQVEEDAVDLDDLIIYTDDGEIDVDPESRDNEKLTLNIYDAAGNAIELADIAEGDILNIVAPAGDINEVEYMDIYVTKNVVTGVVEEDHGRGYFTIDGTKYFAEGAVATELANFPEGIFYITIDGRVYATEAEKSISKDFAIIIGHEVETSSIYGSVVKVYAYTVEAGDVEEFTVASTLKYNGEKLYRKNDDATKLQTAKFGVEGEEEDSAFADFYENVPGETDRANLQKRLFAYKTNSAGELAEIVFAGTADLATDFGTDEYDEFEVFDSNEALADTVIIAAKYEGGSIDTEKISIATFADLNEDTEYTLNYYTLEAGEIAIATYAGALKSATDGSHFAVVTGRSTVYDAANDGYVTKYTFIQSGEELTATVAYDSMDEFDDMIPGDVFRYGLDAEGNIDTLEPVALEDNAEFTAKESVVYGEVSVADKTSTGKRYIKVGEKTYRFADAEGATFVKIDADKVGTIGDAAIDVTSISGIKASTSRTMYEVLLLLDEDELIVDAIVRISAK